MLEDTHSPLGITSLIIAAIGYVLIGLMVYHAHYLDTSPNEDLYAELFYMTLGLLAVACLHFLGLILAMIGLLMRSRRRVTAIVGLLLNIFPGILLYAMLYG